LLSFDFSTDVASSGYVEYPGENILGLQSSTLSRGLGEFVEKRMQALLKVPCLLGEVATNRYQTIVKEERKM